MEPTKWKIPPPDFYKINWDTATDQNKEKIVTGTILRNLDGLVDGTLRISQPYPGNSFVVEALRLFYASKFCKDIGITQFITEGDALQVVQLLKSTHSKWSRARLIIQDAKNLLNTCANWSYFHVKREGNQMVHLLAKDALVINSDLYDIDHLLDYIRHVLQLDSL